MKERVRVHHTIRSTKIPKKLTFAVVADLHAEPFDDMMVDLRASDAILVPGDLVNRHRKKYDEAGRFLKEAPEAAPVFYSMGNHERKAAFREEWMEHVYASDVRVLDDESTRFEGICLGGLSSHEECAANTEFLDRFEKEEGFKLLLCHHPEMWRDDVDGRDIDFTICGHAHGGQWQIRGRGVYAPGQGFFPKLTHGLHGDGKMMISRGVSNGAWLPRINNPLELIILHLEPEEE